MKIKLTSVPIDDYDQALKFYTEVLALQRRFTLQRHFEYYNDVLRRERFVDDVRCL
jgi:catechol 2,3-dioxygenase-like lactoylglutathione lyase family enzyme